MSVTSRFGLSLSALCAIGLTAFVVPACSSTPSNPVTTTDAGSSGNYCGVKGATCCALPGQVPNPECDDGDETQCPAAASACAITQPQCGSVGTAAAPSCEPMTNNTGATTQGFRMRRIILVAPSALANSTVQNVVVNTGVDTGEPQCGNASNATGDFSWLLSINTTANTIQTGGAPPCDLTDTPSCDPFNTGYCFVNKTVNGIAIGPISSPLTKASDGTLSTATIPSLNIPIYLNGAIITLPINNGSMSGIKVSSDGNCIGSINTKALGPDCSDNYQTCSKWLTDGSLTGFITLAQADQVNVTLLSETLCVLLTGDKTGQKNSAGLLSCPKDASGKITDKGNYCSSPAGAGGCDDSFWLAATFSASAVKINDGTGIPDCSGGGGTTDAGGTGTDAAGATDATAE